jgi:hypothetical protein
MKSSTNRSRGTRQKAIILFHFWPLQQFKRDPSCSVFIKREAIGYEVDRK